jgi:hypothetical protein
VALMRAPIAGFLLAIVLGACVSPARAEDHLAPLAFLEGCWIGAFEGQELQDRRCFAAILNGHAVRDTHTVLGVGYGGETTYVWNAQTQRIEVSYLANDGGLMSGSVALDADGVLRMSDGRYVGADGEVLMLRSHWRRSGEGFTVVTEQQRAGAWAPLMAITYVRAPRPDVGAPEGKTPQNKRPGVSRAFPIPWG